MPSIVSAADAFLVLLALLGIVTGSLGSPKQAGIHLPQRGQDGHQSREKGIDRLGKREPNQTPVPPEWRGGTPVPDYGIPGPENPEGNPWRGRTEYPQPPDGKDPKECRAVCLESMPSLSPHLPWILGAVESDTPRKHWREYCSRRCAKIYGSKSQQKVVVGKEHPSKDPPKGEYYSQCMKWCRDWYYNPLDFSGDGSQPRVKKRCRQHCGEAHPSHADRTARIQTTPPRHYDSAADDSGADDSGRRRPMTYHLGDLRDQLTNGIRSFRSGKWFRDLGAAMSEQFGGADARTERRPGFSGAARPAIRPRPVPR